MSERVPEQDVIYDYHFLYNDNECKVTLANPVLDENINFIYGNGLLGSMKIVDIINIAYKRVNIVTGSEDLFE